LSPATVKAVVDSFVLPSTHGGITTSPSQHHQPPETSTQRHSSFFLKESLREGDRRINKRKVNANKQQRWHRRIFSKLSRNQRDAAWCNININYHIVMPGLTLDQHLFILKLGQVFPLPAEGMF
jgi:hypothetical protein